MPDIFVASQNEKLPEKEETREPLLQTTRPLTAFALSPAGIHFEAQNSQEQIILLLRRHWVTNVPWLLEVLFLFFLPILFPFIFRLGLLPSFPTDFRLVLLAFWYLVSFGLGFISFLNWYFNAYIVTNERVVDIDFYNLLYKQVSDTRIAKIQDVTYRVGGIIRSFFDFGDVFIQTAGTERNFEFEAVPKPEIVVRKISQLMGKEEL